MWAATHARRSALCSVHLLSCIPLMYPLLFNQISWYFFPLFIRPDERKREEAALARSAQIKLRPDESPSPVPEDNRFQRMEVSSGPFYNIVQTCMSAGMSGLPPKCKVGQIESNSDKFVRSDSSTFWLTVLVKSDPILSISDIPVFTDQIRTCDVLCRDFVVFLFLSRSKGILRWSSKLNITSQQLIYDSCLTDWWN